MMQNQWRSKMNVIAVFVSFQLFILQSWKNAPYHVIDGSHGKEAVN